MRRVLGVALIGLGALMVLMGGFVGTMAVKEGRYFSLGVGLLPAAVVVYTGVWVGMRGVRLARQRSN